MFLLLIFTSFNRISAIFHQQDVKVHDFTKQEKNSALKKKNSNPTRVLASKDVGGIETWENHSLSGIVDTPILPYIPQLPSIRTN